MALSRIVLDTNAAYPMSVLDLALRLDEADMHRVLWTEDLLTELATVWVRNGARSLEAATRVCQNIRDAFADQQIPRAAYEHLIASMPGRDQADHVHAAAAASQAPCTLVTANDKDFPSAGLADLGVTVIRPDAYFTGIARTHPIEVNQIIDEMAAHRRNPTLTPADVIAALDRAGLTKSTGLLAFAHVAGVDNPTNSSTVSTPLPPPAGSPPSNSPSNSSPPPCPPATMSRRRPR